MEGKLDGEQVRVSRDPEVPGNAAKRVQTGVEPLRRGRLADQLIHCAPERPQRLRLVSTPTVASQIGCRYTPSWYATSEQRLLALHWLSALVVTRFGVVGRANIQASCGVVVYVLADAVM